MNKGDDSSKAGENDMPPKEHTLWLLDKFREGLGSSIDIGDEGTKGSNGSFGTNKTGLWWDVSYLDSDGGVYGDEYVSRLNEPNGAVPSMGQTKPISTDQTKSGFPVFRSGRSKNVRENWKVVCADGGSDLAKSAVPGFAIGGWYTGVGAKGTEEKVTVAWSDWAAGGWSGWVSGMFGDGSGTKMDKRGAQTVKVRVYEREGRTITVKTPVYAETETKVGSKTKKKVTKTIEEKTIDVPGTDRNRLDFEPANVWRRRLTWGFGWWRVELVPYVGTDRMTKVKSDGTLVLEKYASKLNSEHTTVMEKERRQVTRRIEWNGGAGTNGVHKAQIVKNGTLEAEVNEKKRKKGEWTVHTETIKGITDKTVETVTNSADDSVRYKVQLEPNDWEKLYNPNSTDQIVTILKKQTDNSGNETVIGEQTKMEWADSGQYTGGWSPFVVRQVPKTGESGLKLESRLNGKWSMDTSNGATIGKENGGDWVSGNGTEETNGFEETDRISQLADWINI